MTVDLENDLRSDRCNSMELVVPKLLDFFDDHKIKATFFTVTSLLDKYESEIKEISRKHEIASHSHTHEWLNYNNSEYEIKKSKKKLEEFRIKCFGFRAPGFIIIKDHFKLLNKYGYKYDSSMGVFFPGRYNNLLIKQKPFVKQDIVEFPMPTMVYPLINSGMSYMKLFHPFSKYLPKRYMFYLHPWEFLNQNDLPKSNSLIKYLLRRNSGKKAWEIFENFICKKNSRWVSCEKYAKFPHKVKKV